MLSREQNTKIRDDVLENFKFQDHRVLFESVIFINHEGFEIKNTNFKNAQKIFRNDGTSGENKLKEKMSC